MCTATKLSHVDDHGKVSMVDISNKEETNRVAIAEGFIYAKKQTLDQISSNQFKKGDVLTTAHIAGIQGAKKTSDLIPLCHPLFLEKISLDFVIHDDCIRISCQASCKGKTGVEMEALTAVSVACLTIYDMCKAIDRSMTISGIRLLEKSGGQSGHFKQSR